MFKRFPISAKLLLLIFAGLAGIVLLAVLALYFIRAAMIEDRVDKVKSLVETAINVAASFEKRAEAGEFNQVTAHIDVLRLEAREAEQLRASQEHDRSRRPF